MNKVTLKRFSFLLSIITGTVLCISTAFSETIGVIQYNVKGGQGGWDKAHKHQVELIAKTISQKKDQDKVDFVALQQADITPGIPDPLLSDELSSQQINGWSTIVSACYYDTTQIAYSSRWQLVGNLPNNPLVNDTQPQYGWLKQGCQGAAGPGGGRPYNMAYFENKQNPSLKVLFVSNHFPHGGQGEFDVLGFINSAKSVTAESDLSKIKLIVAGDMNTNDYKVFNDVFGKFGNVKVSQDFITCCQNDNWIYAFDHIVTNSPHNIYAEIIEADYPLNKESTQANEEHKSIYGKVEFD